MPEAQAERETEIARVFFMKMWIIRSYSKSFTHYGVYGFTRVTDPTPKTLSLFRTL